MLQIVLLYNVLYKTLRENNILKIKARGKQLSYFRIPESCDSTTDSSHKESKFRMLLCILYELINIWFDHIHSPMHCRNCIALSLHSDSLSPNCTEVSHCRSSCSAAMGSSQIASKNKDLALFEFLDVFWRIASLYNTICPTHHITR